LPALRHLARAGLASLAAALVLALAFGPAWAAPKKTGKEEAKPALVATFGGWNVFTSRTGKGRICYTLAQPKTREPASLQRDPGYAFISDRPAEGVRNEVSFIMGFEIAAGAEAEAKPEADKTEGKPDPKHPKPKAEAKAKPKAAVAPVAVIDEASFDLLPKGANLWVKNAARESALIGEMKKGSTLVIKAASLKGNASTDTYSLEGFSQAMDRLQKECSGKP
jgi:Invasion associated locus B (IalB) protein